MSLKSDLSFSEEVNLNDSEEFLRNSTANKKEEPKRNSQATTSDLSSEDRIPSNLSRN